ncbi:ABC transporter substrate-binding protein [Motiliproteus sp. MSK22-1]|uniref:ABC transporter substrate-binding protein n=1 Tax=Motiliproteus sp. MSK22-1 TaxID=1897630 RepID=UPI0009778ABA|nr:ABC transporter substrate-binding protein [Motiliproteus sp. MSK22-1]OMH25787.1 peptide ABC transporter substrate-binding protein [Motiliproteus sp. MSK22-1]
MKCWLYSLLFLTLPVSALDLQEPPYLMQEVAAGNLPAIEHRLPSRPYVDSMTGLQLGKSGGRIQMLMGRPKDIRRLVVYGYARLVGFNEKLQLEADILESYEVEEGRIFTLNLRPGHRWSDGHPFTSEDFRYYWEDIANNRDLASFGPPHTMTVNGEPARFEILGPYSVRYSWDSPNPDFLTALAGPSPLYIYRPAHYLKQFHLKYQTKKQLKKLVKQAKTRNRSWVGLHQRMDHQYKNDNPDLPTLQPWYPVTKSPSERFLFKRNPYYHRVDALGNQLPYLDEVIIQIASSKLIPAKTGAGESDLQGQSLRLDNYTFLKEGELLKPIKTLLWSTSRGSRVAIYPNLNTVDDEWRKLFRDVRFRRALSMAVNRHEINQVIFFGLALEGANTLIPESPLYRPELRSKWASFDLKKANQLLDELGLTERDERGVRLLPDGRPMEIIIQSAGESTEETDILELVHDTWIQAGIKIFTKPSEREVFRNRVFSGDALMSVWWGLPNGIASADMSPAQLAPTEQQQLQWPKWGKHYETGEESPPDQPEVQRLVELMGQWRQAVNDQQRLDAWQEMLEIWSDQVYTIGTVSKVLQPIVVHQAMRNVPEKGLWNWEPNAYFGVYRLERFWFDPEDSLVNK